MIPSRLISSAISAWVIWRNRKKLYRTVPELRSIDLEIVKARRAHRSVRPLETKKQQLMSAALRGEVG
jgi:hypothetical protein